ncbi:hypothetical protein JVX93_15750 [Mycolicibacterium boenickei]|nr:hypothetical protein JVX93_15750 [Mycolicibacterium boenickei]
MSTDQLYRRHVVERCMNELGIPFDVPSWVPPGLPRGLTRRGRHRANQFSLRVRDITPSFKVTQFPGLYQVVRPYAPIDRYMRLVGMQHITFGGAR